MMRIHNMHRISKVKQYILLNEEGNTLNTADIKHELHNLMLYLIQGDQDRGFETTHCIVKSGNLIYSTTNYEDRIFDDDLSERLQLYGS